VEVVGSKDEQGVAKRLHYFRASKYRHCNAELWNGVVCLQSLTGRYFMQIGPG